MHGVIQTAEPSSAIRVLSWPYLAGERPNPPPESSLAWVRPVSFILTRGVRYSSLRESWRHRIEKPVRVLCEPDVYISHSLLRTYQKHSATDEMKLCEEGSNIISTITNNIGRWIKELSIRKWLKYLWVINIVWYISVFWNFRLTLWSSGLQHCAVT